MCIADPASPSFDAEVAELLRLALRHDKPYDHVVNIVRLGTPSGRKLVEVVLEEIQEVRSICLKCRFCLMVRSYWTRNMTFCRILRGETIPREAPDRRFAGFY